MTSGLFICYLITSWYAFAWGRLFFIISESRKVFFVTDGDHYKKLQLIKTELRSLTHIEKSAINLCTYSLSITGEERWKHLKVWYWYIYQNMCVCIWCIISIINLYKCIMACIWHYGVNSNNFNAIPCSILLQRLLLNNIHSCSNNNPETGNSLDIHQWVFGQRKCGKFKQWDTTQPLKNKMTLAGKWMGLEKIILSKVSKNQNN